MEMTPQQISQFHTGNEIVRQVNNSLAALNYAKLERKALAMYPPETRAMYTVPRAVRDSEVKFIAEQMRRQPRRRKHVLP